MDFNTEHAETDSNAEHAENAENFKKTPRPRRALRLNPSRRSLEPSAHSTRARFDGISPLHDAKGSRPLIPREDARERGVGRTQMARHDLAEHVPEVGRDREVSAFEAIRGGKARPRAVDASAHHRTADHHHRVAVTVVGSAVAVLGDRPS